MTPNPIQPTTTLCWRCDEPYPYNERQCPKCGAANANVDYERAIEQQDGEEKVGGKECA
jgi:Zn finger protein HypA/HybF involved in hydrogenase expression